MKDGPVDFGKDDHILANWSRVIDSDKIVDEFRYAQLMFNV
jgi:hypothetical protein